MKRIFLAAIAVIGLFSCEKKQNKNPNCYSCRLTASYYDHSLHRVASAQMQPDKEICDSSMKPRQWNTGQPNDTAFTITCWK